MALLNNKCRLSPCVFIDLTFEDDIRKQYVVHINDIVSLTYNKAGLATRHVGKVTQIGSGDYRTVSSVPKFYGSSGVATYDTVIGKTKGAGDYMIIDGSGDFAGNIVVVYLNTILDFDMISQYDASLQVNSAKPNPCCGINQITTFRVYRGKPQFSTDNGQNWYDMEGNKFEGPECSVRPCSNSNQCCNYVADGDQTTPDEPNG